MEKFLKNFLKKLKLNEPAISTIFGGLIIVVVGILIFNYFKAEQGEQLAEEPLELVTLSQEMQEAGVELKEVETEEGTEIVQVYTVKEGDYLWKISEELYQDGYKWTEIAELNNLATPDFLEAGQELKMPRPAMEEMASAPASEETLGEQTVGITGEKYTVQENDNLWDICVHSYGDGYKWPEVARENNLYNPDYLEVGQELKLPR